MLHFSENKLQLILMTFQAIHKLSLIVSGDYTAISNTKPSSTTSMDGRKTKYEFSSTPIIPTSLLAFSIGEFQKVSRTVRLREGQIDLRVWGHDGYEIAFRSTYLTNSFYKYLLGYTYKCSKTSRLSESIKNYNKIPLDLPCMRK